MLPSSSSAIAAMASCGKNIESDPIGAPRLELLAWLPTLALLLAPPRSSDGSSCPSVVLALLPVSFSQLLVVPVEQKLLLLLVLFA